MGKWTAENTHWCWVIRGPNGEEYTLTGAEQVKEITAKLNKLEDFMRRDAPPRAIEGDMDGSEISGWGGQDEII